MKRMLTFIAFCILVLTATAQNETQAGVAEYQEEEQFKDFGGFILDMATMINTESLVVAPPSIHTLKWDAGWNSTPSGAFVVNPNAFRITDMKFNSGFLPSTNNGRLSLQGATYRLNDKLRLNTYGEYDADGYKRYNPAALPWERNDFNAAFEMKSGNGKFGIRLEVERR